MGRIRAVPLAQRIAVVIALALALAVLGRYLTSVSHPSSFGWYAYAPLKSSPPAPEVGPRAWARALIWLGLVVAWAVPAVWLLRLSRRGVSSSGTPDAPTARPR
jgi:heme/copper-type cytochrome/quinol oxidase subunit 1